MERCLTSSFEDRESSGGSDGKESACSVGGLDSIPGLERPPGNGSDYPLLYSCLENPWTEDPGGCIPWSCKESDTTEHTHTQPIPELYFYNQGLNKMVPMPSRGWSQRG